MKEKSQRHCPGRLAYLFEFWSVILFQPRSSKEAILFLFMLTELPGYSVLLLEASQERLHRKRKPVTDDGN
jgi:hypothetical protein